MELKSLYREIVNEHNLHPEHKHALEGANMSLRGVNPSCGDDITLELKVTEDGIIEDASYTGSGCAISQASADMMVSLMIGKSREDAVRIAGNFMDMIHGEKLSEEVTDELDEAAALSDIAHMPARAKCAVLSWRTLRDMLQPQQETDT